MESMSIDFHICTVPLSLCALPQFLIEFATSVQELNNFACNMHHMDKCEVTSVHAS